MATSTVSEAAAGPAAVGGAEGEVTASEEGGGAVEGEADDVSLLVSPADTAATIERPRPAEIAAEGKDGEEAALPLGTVIG